MDPRGGGVPKEHGTEITCPGRPIFFCWLYHTIRSSPLPYQLVRAPIATSTSVYVPHETGLTYCCLEIVVRSDPNDGSSLNQSRWTLFNALGLYGTYRQYLCDITDVLYLRSLHVDSTRRPTQEIINRPTSARTSTSIGPIF